VTARSWAQGVSQQRSWSARRGLIHLLRILERVVTVSERGLGIRDRKDKIAALESTKNRVAADDARQDRKARSPDRSASAYTVVTLP
jgi:hypothetical protein